VIDSDLFEFLTERKVVGTFEDLKTGKTTKVRDSRAKKSLTC
jgi:hypothetical protein